jgi:hypothetical protein
VRPMDLQMSHSSIIDCTHFIWELIVQTAFQIASVLNSTTFFLFFESLPINSGMDSSRLLSNCSERSAHDSGDIATCNMNFITLTFWRQIFFLKNK